MPVPARDGSAHDNPMSENFGSYLTGLPSLLFVYNTDSSRLPAPRDYTSSAAFRAGDCLLRALTYSPLGMKKEWKRFIRDLGIPSRFLDRNEFLAEFGTFSIPFPVVLFRKGTEFSILIGADEIVRCMTLADLILLLEQHLELVRREFGLSASFTAARTVHKV